MERFDQLLATIIERRSGDPATSYVAKLTAKGRAKMAQKLGEEAVEVVIAAMSDDKPGMVSESADLMFHLAVLLAASLEGLATRVLMDPTLDRRVLKGELLKHWLLLLQPRQGS